MSRLYPNPMFKLRPGCFDEDQHLSIRALGSRTEYDVTFRELCKLVQLTAGQEEGNLPGMSNEYGSELRRIRLEKGISLRRLARELEVSAAYLSDIERGNRLPLPEDATERALKFMKAKSEILLYQALLGRVRSKHPEASEATLRKITKLLMQDNGGS